MRFLLGLALFFTSAASQQIFDIVSGGLLCGFRQSSFFQQYETTWDRKSLFTYTNLGTAPINFVAKGEIGDANIVVNVSAFM
jgi:hypothetical protein